MWYLIISFRVSYTHAHWVNAEDSPLINIRGCHCPKAAVEICAITENEAHLLFERTADVKHLCDLLYGYKSCDIS